MASRKIGFIKLSSGVPVVPYIDEKLSETRWYPNGKFENCLEFFNRNKYTDIYVAAKNNSKLPRLPHDLLQRLGSVTGVVGGLNPGDTQKLFDKGYSKIGVRIPTTKNFDDQFGWLDSELARYGRSTYTFVFHIEYKNFEEELNLIAKTKCQWENYCSEICLIFENYQGKAISQSISNWISLFTERHSLTWAGSVESGIESGLASNAHRIEVTSVGGMK